MSPEELVALTKQAFGTSAEGYSSPVVIAKAVGAASSPALVGTSPAAEAAVTQWLGWAFSELPANALDILAAHLTNNSYIAGSSYSIADAVVYFALIDIIKMAGPAIARHRPIARWLRTVLAEPGYAGIPAAAGAVPFVPPAAPVKFASTAAAPAPAKPAASPVAVASAPAPAAAAAAPAVPAGEAPAAAAAPAGEAKKEGKKKEKKEPSAPAAPPAPAPEEADPLSVCDFRVGIITKAWVHPTADKLYCEEIDTGDASGPRTIASGLRAHYSLEEMQGRRVVVIANLKPRPLVGFMSHGMVLCATSAEGKVEFVVPPEAAKAGERVAFAGHEGAAAADPKVMDKKKVFDKVAPGLRVDEAGVATWEGIPFMTSAGPCTAVAAKGGLIK